MRVSFDHQTFELQRYGGISRYFCELASHLARSPDCNVSIVAPLHLNEYLRSLKSPVHTTAKYIGNIPRTRRLAQMVNRQLGPFLMRIRRPDIVHRTYFDARLPAVKGARTVITVYDMIHERFQRLMADVGDAVGKRAAVAAADHVICISESTRRDLIEIFGVNPAKTSVVHLGFDLMPDGGEPLAVLPPRDFILYVGQRWGYKNFDGLLAAYAASPRLRENFDIVCFGGGPFNSDEQSAISAAGVRTDAVRQMGGSDAALSQLYQKAAVFVYPSLYEGFGIPPLEAMSFDCPVVCCDVASMPEVVGQAACFFEAGDVASLRVAIERVLGDANFRNELVQRGRDRLKLFSWQRCAEQTLAIYQRVLS